VSVMWLVLLENAPILALPKVSIKSVACVNTSPCTHNRLIVVEFGLLDISMRACQDEGGQGVTLSGEWVKDIKLDHVGIAVKNMKEAVELFEHKLGGRCLSQNVVESQKIKSAKVEVGQVQFELMEPTSPESVVGKFIANRGEGIHHLSLQVPDLGKAIQSYREKGMEVGQIISGENYRVAFVHPRSVFGILLELIERI